MSASADATIALLRQAAERAGLLDGGTTEAAIEALLEREVKVPEPSEEACLRYYTANASRYRSGERVRLRHVLFAVTPGVDVVALRQRAEACLLDVRCHDGHAGETFANAARTLSNCPSGAQGGELGWLAAADCAPEFGREVFGHAEVGVLPRLVHSRFGLHVVEVLERDPGVAQSFESVHGAVAMQLRQQAYVAAVRQYVQLLAGDTPLVQ